MYIIIIYCLYNIKLVILVVLNIINISLKINFKKNINLFSLIIFREIIDYNKRGMMTDTQ